MKSHELARKLLDLPDAEVILVATEDSTGTVGVDPAMDNRQNVVYIYSD